MSPRLKLLNLLPSFLKCAIVSTLLLAGLIFSKPMSLVADETIAPGGRQESASDADGLEYFETHIRPVLIEHCYECHSTGSKKSQGDLLLDSRESMRAGGASGPAVVPGDVEASLILDALRHETFEMPPSGKLNSEIIERFEEWIRKGAVDPRESTALPPGLAKVDWSRAREHWSFKPMEQVVAPEILGGQSRSAVDAFVLPKLQEAEIEPNPEASREVWLRRVTFDLIGLPPTPAELEAFIKDEGSDAFERVVDRLLASPRYGERYGRHWLDLARYADSNGADENHGYPVAWRFRDYVVESYNADLPYDRFVVEQLAGDLLPSTSEEERRRLLTATGMLVIGPKMLAEQDKPKLVADLVDEQMDTVGKVFLGLTLGCARCHDHKFDPIKAEDYYALAGIFHSTKSMEHLNFVSQWNERELPNTERSQRIAAHGTQLELATSELKQYELQLQNASFEKQIQALAQHLKWRASAYQPTAAEISELGLTEPQAKQILAYAERGTWRDAHALELIGEDLRKLVKELSAPGDLEQIRAAILEAFRVGFAEVLRGERDDKGKLKDERLRRISRQLFADKGPFEAIEKFESSITSSQKDQLIKLRDSQAAIEKATPALDKAMAADEGPLKLVSVHVRGNHLQLVGDPVIRRVPEILQPTTAAITFPDNQSGRLEFASWVTSPGHPLTARVMINRIWQYHFGEGLVRSASNFGLSGDVPTHPELLDYLAQEFVSHDWSQKSMHRRLVLSSTYRRSSLGQEHGQLVDPDNRLLWRMNRRRLEVEPLRDSLLTVADELDAQTGGQAQSIYGTKFEDSQESKTIHDAARRTIYLPINRAALEEFFATFDYVDSAVSLEKRPVTTVPHQALFLMNHRLVLHAGWRLAKRLEQYSSDDRERLKFAYAVCFARQPSEAEIGVARDFLESQRGALTESVAADRGPAKPEDSFEPWVMLCRSLLITNEFLYVE